MPPVLPPLDPPLMPPTSQVSQGHLPTAVYYMSPGKPSE